MIFQRKIMERLRKQAEDRKISLLIGPRQVGKTTLLKLLFKELSVKRKCVFLDLDVLTNYEKVSTFDSLLNLLRLNGYREEEKEFFYLFLDEFQRYPDVVKVMKNAYDHLENVKIFASGSSSLTIKSSIQESLAGRKIINEIFSLDFEEFLLFKGEKRLVDTLKNIKKTRGDNLATSVKEYRKYLEEFLIFGGYPEVVLTEKKEEKRQILESIFDLYVKKDLVEYLNIRKILNVKRLIEFLAINNGQKIKYEEIANISSLKLAEVKEYLEVLSETYIIEIVRPYYSNKNKEIVKIPKVYFIDNGVRNYFILNFNELRLRNDSGFLFEGFVLSELLKQGRKEMRFWQDKNSNEVDFIIEEGERIIPVEVKYKETIKLDDEKGLKLFFASYKQVKRGYLINLASQKQQKNIFSVLPYHLQEILAK